MLPSPSASAGPGILPTPAAAHAVTNAGAGVGSGAGAGAGAGAGPAGAGAAPGAGAGAGAGAGPASGPASSSSPSTSASAPASAAGVAAAAAAAATAAPAPAAVAAGTKRPATSDLQRAGATTSTPPAKRHAAKGSFGSAVGSAGVPAAAGMQTPSTGPPPAHHHHHHHHQNPPTHHHGHGHAPAILAPALVTEEQLMGRTPEQLMATILQIQAQHQQYVASISAQYENISHQLNELRGSLAAFYSGQAASHQAAASQLQHSAPIFGEPSRIPRQVLPAAPPLLPQGPPPGPSRGSISYPAARPARAPPQSPLASHSDARLLPKHSPAQAPQTPGPPAYDYRTVGTVEEVWKEYREGMDGQPAIEELDATWGSRWRPEPRGRTWYSRRKVIWDKIKEHMSEGMDEDEAVREVEKLRDGGTINKLIRMLQEERKERGIPDESVHS